MKKGKAQPRRRFKWYSAELRAWQNVQHRHRNTGAAGCMALEAIWDHCPTPIGTIWYRWNGKRSLEVMDIYVPRSYRRHGVARRLLNILVRDFPKAARMTTETVNRQSRPLMLKCGFIETELDGWFARIPGREKIKR